MKQFIRFQKVVENSNKTPFLTTNSFFTTEKSSQPHVGGPVNGDIYAVVNKSKQPNKKLETLISQKSFVSLTPNSKETVGEPSKSVNLLG